MFGDFYNRLTMENVTIFKKILLHKAAYKNVPINPTII